ncbi:unnamed protein product [Phyllotreta striolata]|uniref:Uncharacterized protein n=1 Tax=Phyllotreta striolata TaxID=444603 RepID=A0A9N9XP45_PHYSR|nr:unnamed protein product [Phyllotreta striolata]
MLTLHEAVRKNDLKIVKEFVEVLQQEEMSVNLVDQNGYTPLHIATLHGYKEIVTLLLEKGANINLSISDNIETPLSLAIKKGYEDIVKLLLHKGADINQRLPKGYAPLHSAIKAKNFNIIKMLVEEGADVNLRDVSHGYSSLHFAVIFYNEEKRLKRPVGHQLQSKQTKATIKNTQTTFDFYTNVIEFLLSKGADINITNWDEEIPLHCAARQNQIQMIKFLMEKGADSTMESSDGDAPVDLITDDNCVYEFIKYIALHNQALKRKNKCHYQVWLDCKYEIEKMKRRTIGNSNVTWLDFLQQNDDNLLEAYYCNYIIRNHFGSDEYKAIFPIYETMLEDQIERSERRYLLTKDIMTHFYQQLPIEDCWRKILQYVNTNDLEKFVNAIYRSA